MTLPACSWCGEPDVTAVDANGAPECWDKIKCMRRVLAATRRDLGTVGTLAIDLANALDREHRPQHAEPVESCDVCRLLARAREWAR
jgi:hypothetical protein